MGACHGKHSTLLLWYRWYLGHKLVSRLAGQYR